MKDPKQNALPEDLEEHFEDLQRLEEEKGNSVAESDETEEGWISALKRKCRDENFNPDEDNWIKGRFSVK